MDTIYYMASCDSCRKIIKALPKNNLVYHDIRQQPLTGDDIDALKDLAGSYEALFSKKAQLYKSLNLKNQNLAEADYRKYLLEHYTFLSRPVFVIAGQIYIGNSQKNIINVTSALANV